MPGDGEVTYPSETGQALIPYRVTEETYDYYEVRNYVNDINQDYTQVLTGYDEKGRVWESYTYGITENSGSDANDSDCLSAEQYIQSNSILRVPDGEPICSFTVYE